MPAISVLIPVYNVELYLPRCIDSILNQTYTDFELILVNDGSSDNSGMICDEYAKKDSRIHVIHQKNGGVSAARNTLLDWAFNNSNSQWIAFIDSDDWVHREYLERLLNTAIENNSAISICRYIDTDGAIPDIDPKELHSEIWNTQDFFVEHNVNAILPTAKLCRKECYQNIRYPVGRIHEDEAVTYKILFEQSNIPFISAPLYFYYTNMTSITHSGQSCFREDKYFAFEEQIEYFHNNGFHEACRHQVRCYILIMKIRWIP